jgi:hypothetical protein
MRIIIAVCAVVFLGCQTTKDIQAGIKTSTPPADRDWPPPLAGCIDYEIVTGHGVPFALENDSDYSAIQNSLVGCEQHYGSKSPCLRIIYKPKVGSYQIMCGAKTT